MFIRLKAKRDGMAIPILVNLNNVSDFCLSEGIVYVNYISLSIDEGKQDQAQDELVTTLPELEERLIDVQLLAPKKSVQLQQTK